MDSVGLPVDPIEAYLDEFTKFRSPAKSTVSNKRYTLAEFFEWLDKKGHEWTRLNEDIVVGYVGNKDIKGQSKKVHLRRIRNFFDWAKQKGYVRANPATKLYSPPKSLPRAMRKSLNKEEVQKLLDALPLLRDVQKFIVVYALARPVRISELTNLRICDIDLPGNRISIGQDPMNPAKTEGSCRYQTIPERALPILKRLMRDRKINDQLFGLCSMSVSRAVKDIFIKAGVDPAGRGSHAFRHTVIERLIFEQKMDPAIVAMMAGNSPETIYKDYLSGATQDQMDKAMRDAERF